MLLKPAVHLSDEIAVVHYDAHLLSFGSAEPANQLLLAPFLKLLIRKFGKVLWGTFCALGYARLQLRLFHSPEQLIEVLGYKTNRRQASEILRSHFPANSLLLGSNFWDYHFNDTCSVHAVPSEDRDAALEYRRMLLLLMHLLYGWTLCLYGRDSVCFHLSVSILSSSV